MRVWTEDRVLRISLPERVLTASVVADGDGIVLMADGDRIEATVVPFGDERHIFCRGETVRLRLANPMAHAGAEEHHGGHLAAPMSGTVVAVLVEPGDAVARGAALLIIEAMKMEHTITAPAAGVVAAVNYRPGDQVQEGADLVDIDETSAA